MRIRFAAALLCFAWLTSCQSAPKIDVDDIAARPGGCPEGSPCPNDEGSKNEEETDKDERRVVGLSCNGPKATIAIADFENIARYGRVETLALSEKLGQRLLKTGCFQVADRKRTRQIMQEMSLGSSGLVQADTAARLGKFLGVDLLVLGTVTQYANNPSNDRDSRIEETARIETTISMTDVESGTVVASETVSGEGLKIRTSSPLMDILQTQSTSDKAADRMLDKAVSALLADMPNSFTGQFVKKPKPKDPNALLAQRVMKEVGTYDGVIDGDIGPMTRAAIREFQKRFDLSVNGNLDDETLAVINSLAN